MVFRRSQKIPIAELFLGYADKHPLTLKFPVNLFFGYKARSVVSGDYRIAWPFCGYCHKILSFLSLFSRFESFYKHPANTQALCRSVYNQRRNAFIVQFGGFVSGGGFSRFDILYGSAFELYETAVII
jgi:hypothetical protein